jgi:hypothetical protein
MPISVVMGGLQLSGGWSVSEGSVPIAISKCPAGSG